MRTFFILIICLLAAGSAFGYDYLGILPGENVGDQFGSAFCTNSTS